MPSAGKLLIDAINDKDLERIKTLLEYGVSPNARLTDTDEDGSVIRSRIDAAARDKSDTAPARTATAGDDALMEPDGTEDESDSDSGELLYSPDTEMYEAEEDYHDEQVRQEWYPIQHAAYLPDPRRKDREQKRIIMNIILDHKPDLLAVFNGKYRKSMAHPLAFLDSVDFDAYDKYCQKDFAGLDWDEDSVIRGPRTVLHSMLEDGAYVYPILMHSWLREIDLESRDPQGRTVLLAACRCFTGASIYLDAPIRDTHITWGHGGGWRPNASGWGGEKGFAEYLVRMGADPYARDNDRKNAAHHVFESYDVIQSDRMPYVDTTYHYLEKNFGHLFDQQDNSGLYPIHTALRRYMWHYHNAAAENWDGCQYRDSLGDFIAGLRSGRDVRDGQGNTVLHYLAGMDFWSRWDPNRVQNLFFTLIEADPRLECRNNKKNTALEILLLDRPYGCELSPVNTITDYLFEKTDLEVEERVWSTLSSQNVDWMVVDEKGRTLLHLLAATGVTERRFRVTEKLSRLLERGVDPGATDASGKTAYQIAIDFQNTDAVNLLETLPGGLTTIKS